jgi:hypothetical protein
MKIHIMVCLIKVYQLASELEIDCHILHDRVIDLNYSLVLHVC